MSDFVIAGEDDAVGTGKKPVPVAAEASDDLAADSARGFGSDLFGDEDADADAASLASRFADLGMDLVTEREALYNRAFRDHDVHVGKAVSKQERDETGQRQSTLVYGEIRFDSFCLAFQKIRHRYGVPGEGCTPEGGIMQRPGGIFYDIGSGTGKPTVAACLMHPFERAYGIEILRGLYEESLKVKERWVSEVLPQLDHDTPIDFIQGDATDFAVHDWSDGDVLFANSTCFDDKLMRAVSDQARALKKGSIFITLTKRLPGAHFTVLESELHQMSWGGATVYIQQKTTDPQPSPAAEDAAAA